MKYKKMDPRIKSVWTKALRSGKYKQGMGLLKNKEAQYCCLGVLCNIGDTKGAGWKLTPDEYSYEYEYNGHYGEYSPPHGILKLCKLSNNVVNKLIYLNDNECYTFKQIADWIEENL